MSYIPKMPHYSHQREALERSWHRDSYGLLLEMGTGKSKVLIDNICMLRESSGLSRALIIAPKGMYANWTNKEIPTHLPDRHAQTTIMHRWQGGGSTAEQKIITRFMRDDDSLKILVMNTEAFSMSSRAREVAEKFVRVGRCLVGVDESSTIKNPDAKRTKRIIKLGRIAQWRRILTGTPVTRSPLDLWAQFEFLEAGGLGYKSFYSFRARYAVMEKKEFGGRSIDVVVGHRDTEHLSRLVAVRASVVRKEDCLDLPPKVYVTRYVEMTDEQRRLYDELRDYCTVELERGVYMTTTQVIVQLLRLHQIVCGHAVSESGDVRDIDTNRLDSLQELVEETTGRNIIWCSYRRDIEKVAARLRSMGRRVVVYMGGVSEEDRADAVFRFQGESNGRICPDHIRADDFVGTPASGGYGLTLTKASTVIYYSNNYDLEKRLQSEDRAHRIGQTKSVLYVDMMCRDTVEQKIIEALHRKETLANMIMDGPARIRELMC
jgi:SNF2 family DNA or RNA helicase